MDCGGHGVHAVNRHDSATARVVEERAGGTESASVQGIPDPETRLPCQGPSVLLPQALERSDVPCGGVDLEGSEPEAWDVERSADGEGEDVPADPIADGPEGSLELWILFSFRRSRMRPGRVLRSPTTTPRVKVTISTRAVDPCVLKNRKSTAIGSSFWRANTTVSTARSREKTRVIRMSRCLERKKPARYASSP